MPKLSCIGSRLSKVTPCFFSASVSSTFSICAKASAGSTVIRIAASLAGSAKPSNALLATMPAGGTRPTREPGGKTGSSARAGAACSSSANAAKTMKARTEQRVQIMRSL